MTTAMKFSCRTLRRKRRNATKLRRSSTCTSGQARDAFVDFSYEEDGFFAVYTGVFKGLDEQERTAKNKDARRPGFGSAGSVVDEVTEFYQYWRNFRRAARTAPLRSTTSGT